MVNTLAKHDTANEIKCVHVL